VGDPALGRTVRELVEARLTAVERGELARAADAARLDAPSIAELEAALRAGKGGGPSPADERTIATAFRRQLNGNRELLATGAASMSPAVRAARTELQRAGEMALLNIDVYNDRSDPALLPRGFTAISDTQAQARFPEFRARDDGSGFYSRVYYDANRSIHVVVNRGTDDAHAVTGIWRGTPDGLTNRAILGGSRTRQVELALDNADAVARAVNQRVVFSGHSLGGTLASLQAARLGKPAIVFNPLGVRTQMLDQLGIPARRLDEHVRSYVVANDRVAWTGRVPGAERADQTIPLSSLNLGWSSNDGFRSNGASNDPHSLTAVLAGLLNRAGQAIR